MKRYMHVIVLLSVVIPGIFCQEESRLLINARPYGSIPLGSSVDSFNFGGGGDISAVYTPPFLDSLGGTAGVVINALPLSSGASSIWSGAFYGGLFYRLPLSERLSLFASGRGGYYFWEPLGWESESGTGGGLFIGAGAGTLFRLSGPLTLGAEVGYDFYSGLYNGLGVKLSISLDLPALEGERNSIEIRGIELYPLFPVLFSFYEKHPVGQVTIVNSGKKTIREARVSFFVERYMDNPMESREVITLQPGEEATVDLYALFTEGVMEITEGTKVSARVGTVYQGKRSAFTGEQSGTLEFYNRNALVWDDDKKIASFITAKDPEIMNFAKNVGSWMQEVKNPAIDENLQKGIALFEAVKSHGVQYEIDPATPFSEFSESSSAIDFIQFPRQTMQFNSGDCDDLTALYTSLLEAVGVETAFITVPGHIYAAFALKTPPHEVKRSFTRFDDLIITEGAEKAWLPVEITMFQDGFEKAWEMGAKQWRSNIEKDQAALFPTHQAWSSYQAVGFTQSAYQLPLPVRDSLTVRVNESITRYVEQEVYPQVRRLEQQIARNQGSVRLKNSLAVIYARYGMYDKALQGFEEIVQREEYLPALTNAANIHYLRENYRSALDLYERALDQEGENRSALLGIARCNHEMENYGFVKSAFEKLESVDPDLAGRFAYLGLRGEEADRAFDAAGLRSTFLWEEEE